ncbi:hypothetical protein FOZ60_010783 [Perkinsus olseni]|uniref:subtilisin n=1 Tax=Perkinsus olseni TaxID=32597 RepID=A0A7J6NEG9_PEROL|nr:hypothetical protein FOZ60_010783 [Perkinsus olseni]
MVLVQCQEHERAVRAALAARNGEHDEMYGDNTGRHRRATLWDTARLGKLLEGYDASGAREKSLTDNHGHGTLMAGILASNINNRFGIAGIADKVKIHPIRVTESQTGWAPVSQISRAWERALLFKDTNILVFAHGDEFTELNEFVYMRLLEKSVEQGVFVVTAASNSERADGSEETPLPWSLADDIPGVVSVAATYATNPTLLLADHTKLASFGAPGTDAWSPRPKRVEGEWLYWERWGSSAAAAATSGVVALMMSFRNFKPLEIERMLLNSTEDRVRTKWGHEMPYGVLRPDLAVKQAIAETRQSQPDESSGARGKKRKANS